MLPPPLPSIDSLVSQPYVISPFSQGMTSDDFRLRHREHGEPVRYWKGYEKAGNVQGPNGELASRDGTLRIEQALAPDIRVIIFGEEQQFITTEFGQVATGFANISALPDELELARGDIIGRTNPVRSIVARRVLEPSGGVFDSLEYGPLARILTILTPDGPLDAASYARSDRGITWTIPAPTTPVLVEFRYFPTWEFLGESDKASPVGTDGKSLPKIGRLRLMKPGEEFLK